MKNKIFKRCSGWRNGCAFPVTENRPFYFAEIRKKRNVFFVIDFLVMFPLYILIINVWGKNVDEYLLQYGVFKNLFEPGALTMSQIFYANNTHIAFTIVSAYLLYYIIFNYVDIYKWEDGKTGYFFQSCNILRARFLVGVLSFVIPALACLIYPLIMGWDALEKNTTSEVYSISSYAAFISLYLE